MEPVFTNEEPESTNRKEVTARASLGTSSTSDATSAKHRASVQDGAFSSVQNCQRKQTSRSKQASWGAEPALQGHDTVRPDKALLPTKFAGQGKQGPASVEKRPCLLPLSALHRDLPVLRSPIRELLSPSSDVGDDPLEERHAPVPNITSSPSSEDPEIPVESICATPSHPVGDVHVECQTDEDQTAASIVRHQQVSQQEQKRLLRCTTAQTNVSDPIPNTEEPDLDEALSFSSIDTLGIRYLRRNRTDRDNLSGTCPLRRNWTIREVLCRPCLDRVVCYHGLRVDRTDPVPFGPSPRDVNRPFGGRPRSNLCAHCQQVQDGASQHLEICVSCAQPICPSHLSEHPTCYACIICKGQLPTAPPEFLDDCRTCLGQICEWCQHVPHFCPVQVCDENRRRYTFGSGFFPRCLQCWFPLCQECRNCHHCSSHQT